MIHYHLKCARGHAFDGWFASSGTFEEQRVEGLLACPTCGTADVDRALMAPALAKAERSRDDAVKDDQTADAAKTEPDGATATGAAGTAPSDSETPASSGGGTGTHPGRHSPAANAPPRIDDRKAAQLREAFRALRRAVEENGVNVGRNFADEARRIHYGEAEERGIYGQASREEARELVEEGIDVLPLPVLPDEHN